MQIYAFPAWPEYLGINCTDSHLMMQFGTVGSLGGAIARIYLSRGITWSDRKVIIVGTASGRALPRDHVGVIIVTR